MVGMYNLKCERSMWLECGWNRVGCGQNDRVWSECGMWNVNMGCERGMWIECGRNGVECGQND